MAAPDHMRCTRPEILLAPEGASTHGPRGGVYHALALGSPAIAARHRGCGTRLIEKDKPAGIHVALPHPPALALTGYIRPVLLGRPEGLFCAAGRGGAG